MRNAFGQFVEPPVRYAVGVVRVRTRHGRGGVRRAFVKVAEPNIWKLRAVVVWESAHGAIPSGTVLHHIDEDPLNDVLDNLKPVTRAEHLALHRGAFKDKALASFAVQRRERRWSTKSTTKRTGRHPNGCTCPLHGSA